MYLRFYNLKTQPFRLTPDPHFFHLAEPHRNALMVLLQGVVRRKGIMVLTGPIGTGKTTVLNAMMFLTGKASPQQRIATAFLVNPILSRDEFLEALLEDFEVECPSKSRPQRLQALYRMFRQVQKAGGTSVLFIDEAHLLSSEVLEDIRLIGNMDCHEEQLLQVVLCGQPELASTLLQPNMKALRQRIALMIQVRGFALEETRRYVEGRLRCAGLSGMSPFTAPALRQIHIASSGVPRLINLLCDEALMMGFQARQQQIGPEMIQKVAAGLAALETQKVQAETLQAMPPRSATAN
jgi:general secretion pathway protein A